MSERQIQRYPLSWPSGWKRTAGPLRERARFGQDERHSATGFKSRSQLTVAGSLGRLIVELRRLGASNEVLSTNVEMRLDGWPRSGQREPEDPGAAVYFSLKGKPCCLACDRWNRVADNIAAIAAHVEAIRAVDRYGVGTMEQAFAGYAQLPAAAEDWRIVLGLPRAGQPTQDDIEEAFRREARKHHPDVGGSVDGMARLNRARELAHLELNGRE